MENELTQLESDVAIKTFKSCWEFLDLSYEDAVRILELTPTQSFQYQQGNPLQLNSLQHAIAINVIDIHERIFNLCGGDSKCAKHFLTTHNTVLGFTPIDHFESIEMIGTLNALLELRFS